MSAARLAVSLKQGTSWRWGKLPVIVWLAVLMGACSVLRAADDGSEVVVIYNTRLPESRDVAEYYAAHRKVPKNQIFGFDLTTDEVISRPEFRDRLQMPLKQKLEDGKFLRYGTVSVSGTNHTSRRIRGVTRASIRYAVLCYGVPLKISSDNDLHEPGAENLRPELRGNNAAVDSELAWLPIIEQNPLLAGTLPNPCYGATNAAAFSPTNGVLMVARLDGPTASIARGLVDKAIEAEAHGLWGRAYFDARGITNAEYKLGDDWIRNSANICRYAGFETVLDEKPELFPASFPMSQIAFYAGWYSDHAMGAFSLPTIEFMPGAFAYHLYSFSAATIRSPTQNWVGPLLAKGVTATMGTVEEPYLSLTPDLPVFFSRFIDLRFSFGEAAYASQYRLSWMTTVVGDPLYRPFAKDPRLLHEELAREHNPLIEWSHLRVVDASLARGAPISQMIAYLESIDDTKQSPVLMEKLGDLCYAEDKPSSSADALQKALRLNPSPQQRTRLTLTLAGRLVELGRLAEAYDLYQQFLKETPDYPDPTAIFRQLLPLAQKLGKPEDAAKYQREIEGIESPPPQPAKPDPGK